MTKTTLLLSVFLSLTSVYYSEDVSAGDRSASHLSLPSILGEDMVLQRDQPLPIWGWSAPGDTVTVRFAGQEQSATATPEGRWEVRLDPMPASSEPREMAIASGNESETITLRNILVGEVWLCSGQSNMQLALASAVNAEKEISEATFPDIRLFTVRNQVAVVPRNDCEGVWLTCSPEAASCFSAAGYFFGRKLHKELGVPVGLIKSSWGATCAEAWTGSETLRRECPEFNDALDKLLAGRGSVEDETRIQNQVVARYREAVETIYQHEANLAEATKIAACTVDDANWKTMALPGNWEANGLPNVDGIVWFRKTIQLPEHWAGKDIVLCPGPIDEVDVTWFNGTQVGARGCIRSQDTRYWSIPREYHVPGALVKGGKNVIAIRVIDLNGQGGLWNREGKADLMLVRRADGSSGPTVPLAGNWKYFVEIETPPVDIPTQYSSPNMNLPDYFGSPSVLYNAMIYPLAPFALRGAIWYQGESNASRAAQYRRLLPALISDWRSTFRNEDLHFLIVQLANVPGRVSASPQESDWAELREAQLMTALSVPNTGLAVTIDIGSPINNGTETFHPKNKQDVGLRLALWALENTYGKRQSAFSGPIVESMSIEMDKIRLHFRHVNGGLVARGGKLKRFAIAGDDKHFVWADAVIDGETVLVSSPEVAKPVAVRYAWSADPEGCNLYNKEGLPASPFRTDNGSEGK